MGLGEQLVMVDFEVTPARLKSIGGGFNLVKIWGNFVLVEPGWVCLCVIFNYNFLCPHNIKKVSSHLSINHIDRLINGVGWKDQ